MTEDDLPLPVKRILETLRLASNIGGEIAKVVAYVSVPTTIFLLVRYLSAVSAPFPISASSSPLYLLSWRLYSVWYLSALPAQWLGLFGRRFHLDGRDFGAKRRTCAPTLLHSDGRNRMSPSLN